MSRRPRITVVGSINMDLVVTCRRIPAVGETVLARSASEFSGGKGANQAVAASRCGADVSLVGRVGRDAFRDRLLQNLRDHRIDIQHVQTSDNCSSGLAVISVEDSGQNAITVVPGANGRVTREDVRQARDLIQSSDLLMLQLEVPIDAVLEAIKIARESNVRVMLDPAPAPEPDQWTDELLGVDLICPNESEAAALVGHPVEDESQAASAARTLRRRGATNVAITMGNRGTMLLFDDETTQGQIILIPAFQVDAVDTTAAGDAFAGALAVDWSQNHDQPNCLVDAAHFASAAGALAACTHGAQPSMATRTEIEKLRRTR